GVRVLGGLQHGDAPLAVAELDRPVQRGRAAIALRARVHDQALVLAPDALRDERLQHRADDELRLLRGDRRFHLMPGADDLDRHVVPELRERDVRALAEAVVGTDQEEDLQSLGGRRARRGRRNRRDPEWLYPDTDKCPIRFKPRKRGRYPPVWNPVARR